MTDKYLQAADKFKEFIKYCDEHNVPPELIISQSMSQEYLKRFMTYWSFNNQTPETD